MPRGRPCKIKKSDDTESGQIKQKRKYTRKKIVEENTADDGTIIKPDAKKRGRKRGRKKESEILMRPCEVVDYIVRNFPHKGVENIRDKVIDGIKMMKMIGDNPYLLYKFTHCNNTYYYDDTNTIMNSDGRVVGFFIKQNDGKNKMFMIERKNKDTRTFREVIDEIEGRIIK